MRVRICIHKCISGLTTLPYTHRINGHTPATSVSPGSTCTLKTVVPCPSILIHRSIIPSSFPFSFACSFVLSCSSFFWDFLLSSSLLSPFYSPPFFFSQLPLYFLFLLLSTLFLPHTLSPSPNSSLSLSHCFPSYSHAPLPFHTHLQLQHNTTALAYKDDLSG